MTSKQKEFQLWIDGCPLCDLQTLNTLTLFGQFDAPLEVYIEADEKGRKALRHTLYETMLRRKFVEMADIFHDELKATPEGREYLKHAETLDKVVKEKWSVEK